MSTFESVCEMVSHGVGIGIVPQSAAKRYYRKYTYKILALEDDWAQRQLCLCYRDWDKLSKSMQNLLIHLGKN